MYAKLVFRNAKRSVKDYLIYIDHDDLCHLVFIPSCLFPAATTNPILEASTISQS